LDSNGKEKIGKTKYYYLTDANEVISVTKSKEMEDIIEEIKKIGGDMTALRLLHSLGSPGMGAGLPGPSGNQGALGSPGMGADPVDLDLTTR
jgi:hypothetical protein